MFFAEGINVINWTYNKDLNATSGQDKGFIRNLVFTVPVVTTPTTPTPTTPTTTTNSSGGGSLGWMTLCLFGLAFRLRTKN
jgi:hypothetical protein